MSSHITSKGITKVYSGKKVLQNVDLDLEAGKIYGMIGRNGAGKTTLLSILSSQNPATSGEVTYDGEQIWENQKVLDHICFSRELNPTANSGYAALKVKEYLRIASIYLPYWDQKMAERLTAEFDLDLKKRIGTLSKGMLSMITIIVAMASKADFTFLDEPAAGLDVVARERFYRMLLEEYTKTGRTFVVSSHIIDEAAEVFEEIIIVDKGKILLKENTQELLDRTFHISGHQDAVDAATADLKCWHEQHMGRRKGVTVLLEKGDRIPADQEISIQKLSLQKVFVALCGEEEKHE